MWCGKVWGFVVWGLECALACSSALSSTAWALRLPASRSRDTASQQRMRGRRQPRRKAGGNQQATRKQIQLCKVVPCTTSLLTSQTLALWPTYPHQRLDLPLCLSLCPAPDACIVSACLSSVARVAAAATCHTWTRHILDRPRPNKYLQLPLPPAFTLSLSVCGAHAPSVLPACCSCRFCP